MVKLTVDYYKKPEVMGGVQEYMSDFQKVYPDFKSVSYVNAVRAITNTFLDRSKFGFFEVETSAIISQYLEKYEKIFKPDVMIKNSIVGTYKKHKTPTVCVIHDNNVIGPDILHKNGYYSLLLHNAYRYVFTKLQETTMRASDVIVANSARTKDTYEKEFGMEMEVIKNGIDTNLFKPLPNKETLREIYGIPKNKKVGITVTGFLPIKGWHMQAKLCQEFPDVFWVIVMKTAPKKPKLKNVKIFSRIPREQLPELYNAADFFILPSAIESCNMVGMEAMSCGLPVIVANSGYFWNPEAKGDYETTDFGIRVNKWKYECYKKALEELLSGEHTFEPRKHVERNNLDLKFWIRAWRKLIKGIM